VRGHRRIKYNDVHYDTDVCDDDNIHNNERRNVTMEILRGRNVNALMPLGVDLLAQHGRLENTRAGLAMVAPWPVISVYERPTERVLFSALRDANPFFHLFESLWMLAGRQDSASLDCYVQDFGARFAEQDGVIHGAYGHRWRYAMGYDQLDRIVDKLRKNPDDRQCVLQMWDASDWLAPELNDPSLCGHDDLLGDWKDRPCNTHVYLRVHEINSLPHGVDYNTIGDNRRSVLDLTVCCRSNDIVWGAYGANAVHFSFLQEYLAGRIGCGVGTMYQLSNNYHGYVDALDKLGSSIGLFDEQDTCTIYGVGGVESVPIGEDWRHWDADLKLFMEWHDVLWCFPGNNNEIDTPDGFRNLWFHVVAGRVCQVNWLWRHGRYAEALGWCDTIEASDWRQACSAWLLRRRK
jgi:thymidylate synthase